MVRRRPRPPLGRFVKSEGREGCQLAGERGIADALAEVFVGDHLEAPVEVFYKGGV